MNGLSRGRSENTSNAFMTLNERLARRAPHGKRSMFETAHGKEPFPRRRGTAGGNIDFLGKNSAVRVWCTGRSPMLTGGTVDSNPSLSARGNLVRRSSREKGEHSEAGQLSPNGCALGVRTLFRVFCPVRENQPHRQHTCPLALTRRNATSARYAGNLCLPSHIGSPRSGDAHHVLNAAFPGCDVANSSPRYLDSHRRRLSFSRF